jgi:hypothetical protein
MRLWRHEGAVSSGAPHRTLMGGGKNAAQTHQGTWRGAPPQCVAESHGIEVAEDSVSKTPVTPPGHPTEGHDLEGLQWRLLVLTLHIASQP